MAKFVFVSVVVDAGLQPAAVDLDLFHFSSAGP